MQLTESARYARDVIQDIHRDFFPDLSAAELADEINTMNLPNPNHVTVKDVEDALAELA